VEAEAQGMTLFCFLWTKRTPTEEEQMAEVRQMVSRCDKHIFFTDMDAPPGGGEDDVVRVPIPKQDLEREAGRWLNHRNMVAHLPIWDYLFQQRIPENYDWTVNVELDHYTSPARLRLTIARYLVALRRGTPVDRRNADGELLLFFGNVFAFNRKTVNAMKASWSWLGVPMNQSEDKGRGCPEFMRGRRFMPKQCPQDIVYPDMVIGGILRGAAGNKVPFYGRAGCGQPAGSGTLTNRGTLLPMACWEMEKNPYWGRSAKGEKLAIEQMARTQYMRSGEEARLFYQNDSKHAKLWELWWSGHDVPIIHHVKHPEALRLARELLRP